MPTISPIDRDDIYSDTTDPEDASENGETQDGEAQDGETVPEEPMDLPKELDVGRTVLMPQRPDGQRFRAKILGRVDEYRRHLGEARAANAQYRVLVGHDEGEKWEELVAYNDLCNLINDDDSQDGIWNF